MRLRLRLAHLPQVQMRVAVPHRSSRREVKLTEVVGRQVSKGETRDAGFVPCMPSCVVMSVVVRAAGISQPLSVPFLLYSGLYIFLFFCFSVFLLPVLFLDFIFFYIFS